ncbi:MAG: hypothetical protein ACR2FN_06140 [Chitinophagaceae bacterium]
MLYCYNPFVLYFQNDDFVHIPLSAQGKLLQHNFFRPICDLSIMLDYYLWGKTAWGFHFTNLLLHSIDSFFVFLLAKNVCRKYKVVYNFPFVYLTALLFFAYAMHSEAVFWILGRSAELGVLFFLPSIIFYLKRNNKFYFFASILCMLLSWLSYESTWVLVFIIIIISLADIRLQLTVFTKELRFVGFVLIAFFIYLVIRFYFIKQIAGSYEASAFYQFNIPVLTEHFFKSMIRSWLPYMQNSAALLFFSGIVFLALVLLFFKTKNKSFKIAFLVLCGCWLISLTPFASFGVDTKGTEGERFLYLPSIFICMIIVLLISKISNNYARNLIFLAVISFQMFFLFKNKFNNQFAGELTKAVINEVAKLHNKHIIYFKGVPQTQMGAGIFRIGLPEGTQWLIEPETQSSIVICSERSETLPLKNPYKVEFKNQEIFDCNSRKIEDTSNVVFNFTDSALLIESSTNF